MGSVRKQFILEGLGCANCAAKMEHNISKLAGVTNVNVNFLNKSLYIDLDEDKAEQIIEETERIVKSIESHVILMEKKKKTAIKEDDADSSLKMEMPKLAAGLLLLMIAVIGQFPFYLEIGLYVVSYLVIGGEVLLSAVRNIIKGQVFDENFLMALATVGAFAIGEYSEAVAVMLFYQIGEMFQDAAVDRSRKSIAGLMDIRPDYANLIVNNEVIKVSPDEVNIDDIILVKPGEKVPLDGIVIEGKSMIDTSNLTGESLPKTVTVNDDVLSGTINQNGLLTIKVKKNFAESTVSKILELVENSSNKKAPTENFITKFARYYTPVVVISAAMIAVIPPIVVDGAVFSESLRKALIFLVVSCPCALVVSIPLGFFGGIGAASKKGILVKGGNYLEALNNVEVVVFDKTGTLTKGVFEVTQIVGVNGYSKEEILEYAAYAESFSNHPIASSILREYEEDITGDDIQNYNEIVGKGIKAVVRGKTILTGNQKLMEMENIQVDNVDTKSTIVHVSIDNSYAGYILISDEIKEDSKETVKKLKELNIKNIMMLTGDNKIVAEEVATEIGISKVYSELLPQDKIDILENIFKEKSKKGKVVFVGDGINDAPVLARADIGIAMGGVGSDAAIEAADIVIMKDEPSKIIEAIKVARKTKKIVFQNIVLALGVKGLILILGYLGMATMWEAVFGDVGVALLAILNSMRVSKH